MSGRGILVVAYAQRRDWQNAKRIVEEQLRETNAGVFEPPTEPSLPPYLFGEPLRAVKDAAAHASQKGRVYREFPGRSESLHRSEYRRALFNLWHALNYFEKEPT